MIIAYRLPAIFLAFFLSNAVFAQSDSEDSPKRFLEFLDPGTKLALTSIEGSGSVILRTFSDERYKVARSLEEQLGASFKQASYVAKTNAAVKSALENYVSKNEVSDDLKKRIMIRPFVKTSFGTVIAMGEDYLLIEIEGEHEAKRILPKASIATIYPDSNPIRLIDPAARAR